MTPLTPEQIAELRAIEAKATPGPWCQHLVSDTCVIGEDRSTIAETWPHGGIDDDFDFAEDVDQHEHNAAFIVAACNTIIPALDEIDRLRAENERLREALRFYANCLGDPNEGPWGVKSTDFGRRAMEALKEPGHE